MTKPRMLLILLLIVGGAGYLWQSYNSETRSPQNQTEDTDSQSKTSADPAVPAFNSGLLTLNSESSLQKPTADGILSQVNSYRKTASLAPLEKDALLSMIAENRATDMAAKGYFDHKAPDGSSIADLARKINYPLLLLGENLVVGRSLSDKSTVQALMDSPPHRENILRQVFTEMGIGIVQIDYDFGQAWLVVQAFGTPRNVCPTPNPGLEQHVRDNQKALKLGLEELERVRDELRAGTGDSESMEALADTFAELEQNHQDARNFTNQLLRDYNNQIESYNACVADIVRAALETK